MKTPKLRFKGFEGDWQKFKIKDICINKWTWTLTKDKVASEYWYPVINWWVSNYWYYFDYNNENAITISSRWENAGYAKYNKWKFRAWWLCYVYESQKHNTQFIGILLNGKEKHIKSTMIARTTIPALNKSEFNEYFITIPKKQEEQEKIWSLFEQLDSHISKNQQKLEKLKNMKHSFLQKLFPKDWSALPELRFKGFEGAWEESELDKKAVFWKGNWYSKNDLTEEWNKIVLYGRLYTKYETIIKDVDTFCFKKENSILSKWWELVVPASWETAEDIARASVINQKGIILWWDLNIIYPTSEINSVFLALNITYWIPHNDMAKRAQWKSVVHIRNSDLWKIILNYPKVKEQEKIWAFFEKLDTQITQQTQKIQKLQNLKQSLLEKMFI